MREDLVYVWIAASVPSFARPTYFSECRELFMRPASTFFFFQKNNFKTGSHGIIYTFKNYFVKMFSVFSNKQNLNRPSVSFELNLIGKSLSKANLE